MRLAIVTSHPIQYQAPWFRALARVTDLEVLFCHRQDAGGQSAAGFGVGFDWDTPILEGYSFRWLHNTASRPGVSSFRGCDTPEIEDVLRTGDFDACIVCGWYLKSYLQTILACKQLGIPVLSRGDSQLATKRPALWTWAKRLPYEWLLASIDAHLFVGQANLEYLQHYGVPPSRLFFVPHFVDNDFFATAARAAEENGDVRRTREALRIPADALVFAFAGKLLERKRPGDLIGAIRIARQTTGLDLWALFIGSGPLQSQLEDLARDVPVRFAGFQNQSQLPAHYRAADAIVLPSDARETWGLVVNEAMACGLPAIVSRECGCSRDLITEGCTGYTFPSGDVQALAAAIVQLAQSLVTDRQPWKHNVRRTIERYSSSVATHATLEALETVTFSGARGRRVRDAELQATK